MNFGYTIIYVQNVEETILFYEKAFGVKQSFLHESKQYGELATGDTKLAFASESLAQSNGLSIVNNRPNIEKSAGFEVAFVTDSVLNAYHQAITAGAVSIAAPLEKPWGQTVAYVSDLNGVFVEICSPVKR